MALDPRELAAVGVLCAAMRTGPRRTAAELRAALLTATAGLPLAHLGAIVAAAEALRGAT